MQCSVDEKTMKVHRLKSPRVFPKTVSASTNNLHSRKSQLSLSGQYVFSVLYCLWSSINKFVAAIDVQKSHSCFNRAYQDWILPQIRIKSVLFSSLSVMCLFAGLSVFSQEEYQFIDETTKWSFKLSLAIMPYVFSCAGFILVIMYYFPQLIEKKQHHVITSQYLTAVVFIPAGNVLLHIFEHGAARMDLILLNAHLLMFTLLYYDQGFLKIMIISITAYAYINLVNIFTTFSLNYATEHPIRQVS